MYDIKNSLKTIIDDLDKSLKCDCLLSALALALTIPDICGKAKYPEIKSIGNRYRKWFDEYIGEYEKKVVTNEEGTKHLGMPYLSGELVYKLRCAFLHSGGANIEKEYDGFKLDNFILRVEKKNEFDDYVNVACLDDSSNMHEYIVNLRRLCCLLLMSAQSFLENESEEIIERLETLKIQDFDKVLKEIKLTSFNANLRKYKIVSWNCNGKFSEKFNEIKSLNANIYIIQECEDPKQSNVDEYKEWSSNHIWIGKDKNRGLGIFARKGIVLEKLDWDSLCLNYFIPVKVNDKFDLLGIWVQSPYIEEYYIYQYVNKHYYNDKTVLFGDFNSNKKFDDKCINRKERGHMSTVDELSKLGFVDAYHYLTKEEQGKETKNTFYLNRHLNKGFHIDHCFVNPKLLRTYEILDDEMWLQWSEHMPCVLEIEVTRERSE